MQLLSRVEANQHPVAHVAEGREQVEAQRDAWNDWTKALRPCQNQDLNEAPDKPRTGPYLVVGVLGFVFAWLMVESDHEWAPLVWVLALVSEGLLLRAAHRCCRAGVASPRLRALAISLAAGGLILAFLPVWGLHIGESAAVGQAQDYHRHILPNTGHAH